jgi:hypothetical protein
VDGSIAGAAAAAAAASLPSSATKAPSVTAAPDDTELSAATLLVSTSGSGLGLRPIGFGVTSPDGSAGFGEGMIGSKVTPSGPVPVENEKPPIQAPKPTTELTPSCRKSETESERSKKSVTDRVRRAGSKTTELM